MKRIATTVIALVLFAVPAYSEQVALVGYGSMNFQHEEGSDIIGSTGLGGDYLYFGEANNLFFGASLARFAGIGPCGPYDYCTNRVEGVLGTLGGNHTWTNFSMSAGYDLEDSLFTPYVSLLHSRLEQDLGIFEETSSDTSLGLGTYIGKPIGTPNLRWYAALLGIGADEQSLAVGLIRTLPNDMVWGGSFETVIDDNDPFNSATLNLRVGYSF